MWWTVCANGESSLFIVSQMFVGIDAGWKLVRFQAGHAVLRAPQADMSRRVVEVDNVRRLSRQAHCHGRAIRIRLSHQAEVASVVVDNNLERRHACCGCGEKPVPLAERLCADQLVHLHNDARGTHRGQKASGARRSGDLGLAFLVRGALARGTWPCGAPRGHEGRLLAAAFSTDSLRTQFEAPFAASLDPLCRPLQNTLPGVPRQWCMPATGYCALPAGPLSMSHRPCNDRRSLCLRILVCVAAPAARAMVCLRHKVLFPSGLHEQPRSRRFPSSNGKWHSAGSPVKLRVAVYRENVIAIT